MTNRRSIFAVLGASLVAAFALWRKRAATPEFVEHTPPGDRYRTIALGDRELHLREDLLAERLLSRHSVPRRSKRGKAMISRREFLRGSGAGAALLTLPPVGADVLAAEPALVAGFAFTDRRACHAPRGGESDRSHRFATAGSRSKAAARKAPSSTSRRSSPRSISIRRTSIRARARASTCPARRSAPTPASRSATADISRCRAAGCGFRPTRTSAWRAAVARFQQGYRAGLGLLESDSKSLVPRCVRSRAAARESCRRCCSSATTA